MDGFILSNTNFDDPRIERLLELKFPFVSFGRTGTELGFPWVDVDGYAGALAATRHLLQQGHRRIICVGWPQGSLAGHHRLDGFRSALAEAGYPAWENQILRAENLQEAAREVISPALELPAGERPTAVLAVSDLMAIGVMNMAENLGLRVGRDLAVVGFDDSPVARFLRPPLTSLAQPLAEVGESLITMLVDLCCGRTLARSQVLLAPTLIVRESSSFFLPVGA